MYVNVVTKMITVTNTHQHDQLTDIYFEYPPRMMNMITHHVYLYTCNIPVYTTLYTVLHNTDKT